MKILELQKGQSLVEVLVALSIFVLGVVSIGLLVLDANVSSRQGLERNQALFLAREGLEAVRSLRDGDFDNIPAGAYGLVLSANKWTLSGTSDTQDQFSRSVTISDIDIDTKKVASAVTWQFSGARQNSVTLTDYLTDWNQTHGAAGKLDLDISGANISATPDTFRLLGVKIRNIGSSSIIIDKITTWWDVTPQIKEIVINATAVWSDIGPGTPIGKQSSGTEINISDFTLVANSAWINIDKFHFDASMTGATFIIKFVMTDASTKYVLVKP